MATSKSRFSDPPVNVRVEHPNGQYTAVECVYSGQTSNGVHHWHAVHPVAVEPGDQVAWDEMPEATEVHLYEK